MVAWSSMFCVVLCMLNGSGKTGMLDRVDGVVCLDEQPPVRRGQEINPRLASSAEGIFAVYRL